MKRGEASNRQGLLSAPGRAPEFQGLQSGIHFGRETFDEHQATHFVRRGSRIG